jgi:hypothetical protein
MTRQRDCDLRVNEYAALMQLSIVFRELILRAVRLLYGNKRVSLGALEITAPY